MRKARVCRDEGELTIVTAVVSRADSAFGVSVFLTPDLAITAGYRIRHLSNGNTSKPNLGFEADTGVLGLSFFFH